MWSGHLRTQTWKLQKYIIRQFNEKLDNLFIKKILAMFGIVWYNVLYKGKDDRTVKDNSASLSDMDDAIF